MDTIKSFKNGKVQVTRGFVTATVDPRQRGMRRWSIEVKPPRKRGKPWDGYRFYYGPLDAPTNRNRLTFSNTPSKAISEEDAWAIMEGGTMEVKVAQAIKMLNWHFEHPIKQ